MHIHRPYVADVTALVEKFKNSLTESPWGWDQNQQKLTACTSNSNKVQSQTQLTVDMLWLQIPGLRGLQRMSVVMCETSLVAQQQYVLCLARVSGH